MTIPLIIFFCSVILIVLFVLYKVPAICQIPRKQNSCIDPAQYTQEKLKETKENFQKRWRVLLEKLLGQFRKIILKTEQFTTKHLYALKRKNKEEEIKKEE